MQIKTIGSWMLRKFEAIRPDGEMAGPDMVEASKAFGDGIR